MADELVIPPPLHKSLDYPILIGASIIVVFTLLLVFVAAKYDHTHGALTISLLLILSFVGAVGFSLNYTIPNDPSTASILGGLVSAVGAIVAFWLAKDKGGRNGS